MFGSVYICVLRVFRGKLFHPCGDETFIYNIDQRGTVDKGFDLFGYLSNGNIYSRYFRICPYGRFIYGKMSLTLNIVVASVVFVNLRQLPTFSKFRGMLYI